MPIWIYVILAFIVIAAVVSYLMRNAVEDKLQYDENEEILYEEKGIKIYSKSSGPDQLFLVNCKIILTNLRIIILQKFLFGDKYKIHYIIWFNDNEKSFSLKDGIVHFKITGKELLLKEKNNKKFIEITPVDTYGLVRYIEVYLNNPEEFIRKLNL